MSSVHDIHFSSLDLPLKTNTIQGISPDSNTNPTKSILSQFNNNHSVQSSSIIRSSPRYNGFKYKGKSPVSDVPELVELCNHFLITKNIDGLAMVARQRGLPPHLRAIIWPVLLKYHPYVLQPYITPDDEELFDNLNINNNEEEIIDKIQFEFRKYLRKGYSSFKHSKGKSSNESNENEEEQDPELAELLEFQKQIFDTIQHAILKFLKKWGTLINYDSGLTWTAIGLAEWFPPLVNSSFVLCGYDDIAKNGTKLRDIYDNSFERYHADPFDSTSQSTQSNHSHPFSAESDFNHLSSNGQSPFKQMKFSEVYERLLLVILHTPEPSVQSRPQSQSQGRSNSSGDSNASINDAETAGTGSGFSTGNISSLASSTVIDIPQTSTHQNYTHHHAQNTKTTSTLDSVESAGESSPLDSDSSSCISDDMPIFGGSIDDRFSFFLYCLRKCLPELSQYLSDENCLNAKSNKGEWINWWFKWCGAKSWSRYDRGRVWDMLLGWRPSSSMNSENLKSLSSEIDDGCLRCLGTDLFYCSEIDYHRKSGSPAATESSDGDAALELQTNDVYGANMPKRINRRNSSIKTLIDAVSIRRMSSIGQGSMVLDNAEDHNNTSTAIEEDKDQSNGSKSKPLKDLPFSRLNPHFEFIFVAIAFLKSKEFALLELEQTEIKEFLNRISSQKIEGFQAGLESEVKETISTAKFNKHNSQSSRQRSSFANNVSSKPLVVSSTPDKQQHQQYGTQNSGSIYGSSYSTHSNSNLTINSVSETPVRANKNISTAKLDPADDLQVLDEKLHRLSVDSTNSSLGFGNNKWRPSSASSISGSASMPGASPGPQSTSPTTTTTLSTMNSTPAEVLQEAKPETNSSINPTTNSNTTSVSFLKNNEKVPKKTSRDIENIIVEAGELWRKFVFKEMEDDFL